MKLDAETFAEWQVDYVKLDGCYSFPSQMDKGRLLYLVFCVKVCLVKLLNSRYSSIIKVTLNSDIFLTALGGQ
jgi:hypothetical protein